MRVKKGITVKDSDNITVYPVICSHDRTALKSGCHLDQVTMELVGATVQLDLDFIVKHPIPDPDMLKQILVSEADEAIASSMDGMVALPFSVNFLAKKKPIDKLYNYIRLAGRSLEICNSCVSTIQDISDKNAFEICTNNK